MIRNRPMKPDLEQALSIGLSALAFLTEDRQRLVRFLDLTGMAPDMLRAQAQSPALLSAVLDHMLADESLLLVFTASAGLNPGSIGPLSELLRHAA